MPVFAYAGRGVAGQTARGELNASDRDAAIVQLRSQGVTVATIEEKKKSKAFGEKKQKITDKDLVVFTRQFATMIDAGLPLVQCLEILAGQLDNLAFREVLTKVKIKVESGSTLADALGDHPKVFDTLYTQLVAAGEIGGILDTILMVGGVSAAVFGFKTWKSTTKGREQWDAFVIRTPLFGPLIRKVAVARFTRTLGTMISSGVPILDALEVVAKTAGNSVVEKAIRYTKEKISEGKTIVQPLAETKVFPPMVVQMIGVGEATGAMDQMLTKIADFYDDEVDAAVAALTSMIEPVMMVFLGAVVGGFLVAMYLPIFSIAGSVK